MELSQKNVHFFPVRNKQKSVPSNEKLVFPFISNQKKIFFDFCRKWSNFESVFSKKFLPLFAKFDLLRTPEHYFHCTGEPLRGRGWQRWGWGVGVEGAVGGLEKGVGRMNWQTE